MAERETGTVKKWTVKGFGYIMRDGMGDSIFVHVSDTIDRQALIPGSKVSFIYEADAKGGKATCVAVEEMAEPVVVDQVPREMGTVKRWNADKGFGFIGRSNGEADAFFHKKSFGGSGEPYTGQAVSFVFEEGPKGAAATEVKEEEGGMAAPVEDEAIREMGTVKRWNAEKGFGFIGRVSGEDDAFFHKKSFGGSNDPFVGQNVSFVFEEGPKGAAAVKVKEEEGGVAEELREEEEEGEEREMGMVKTYNEEKGFAFIARCLDGTEIFGHKREFAKGLEPEVGQPVSFVYETTEKGGTAKKIRLEDSVPEIPLSDEGREFGTIKSFNTEKGFGFVVSRKGAEEVRFFEKALNEVKPDKHTCVSYVREEGEKGALAKDLREEDPDRVMRVTAKVRYGKVVIYKDPPASKPDAGYGFIVELDQLTAKVPKKHYFHMSEIMTPDDEGGIDLDTGVSFIVIPAKKGFQAAAVTIADPPKEEEEVLETAMDEMHVGGANGTFGGASGTFGGGDATFGGGDATFGGASETFGGGDATFGGANETFGGTTETFGGGDETFGGAKETFGTASETFGGTSETFGGAKETLDGANETFSKSSETFSGASETFDGAKEETVGGANETFGGAKETSADAPSENWGSGGW